MDKYSIIRNGKLSIIETDIKKKILHLTTDKYRYHERIDVRYIALVVDGYIMGDMRYDILDVSVDIIDVQTMDPDFVLDSLDVIKALIPVSSAKFRSYWLKVLDRLMV